MSQTIDEIHGFASVLVTWLAAQEDDADFIGGSGEQQTLLQGGWANVKGNGTSVAKWICEDYFDDTVWDEWWGMDSTDVTVRFKILSPPANSGDYAVHLRRVTRAEAEAIEPNFPFSGSF